MRFEVDKFRTVAFNYSGNIQQPSIAQQQPVRNNNNPLEIEIGNPSLRPSFTHQFSAEFSEVKPVFRASD